MTDPDAPGVFRVLTVNIHRGVDAFNRRSVLAELRDAVRAVGSDVVFLQEVDGGPSGGPAHGLGPQAEFLADRIWPEHAYARNAVVAGRDHGNAVLSRWPVLHWCNHDVSHPRAEPRGLLHCVLGMRGGRPDLHVVCVHLGLRQAERQHQLTRLCETIRREVPDTAPLVVAGDFNDWRSTADAVLRRCGLEEVHRRAHGRHARSFPARWPLLRLDRIYVRGVAGHRPLAMPRRPWTRLSDHAPLAAEIELVAA